MRSIGSQLDRLGLVNKDDKDPVTSDGMFLVTVENSGEEDGRLRSSGYRLVPAGQVVIDLSDEQEDGTWNCGPSMGRKEGE